MTFLVTFRLHSGKQYGHKPLLPVKPCFCLNTLQHCLLFLLENYYSKTFWISKDNDVIFLDQWTSERMYPTFKGLL